MRIILSIFMLGLAIAIFARRHGVPLEEVKAGLEHQVLLPLLNVLGLLAAVLLTWALYRIGRAVWLRRQQTPAR